MKSILQFSSFQFKTFLMMPYNVYNTYNNIHSDGKYIGAMLVVQQRCGHVRLVEMDRELSAYAYSFKCHRFLLQFLCSAAVVQYLVCYCYSVYQHAVAMAARFFCMLHRKSLQLENRMAVPVHISYRVGFMTY